MVDGCSSVADFERDQSYPSIFWTHRFIAIQDSGQHQLLRTYRHDTKAIYESVENKRINPDPAPPPLSTQSSGSPEKQKTQMTSLNEKAQANIQ